MIKFEKESIHQLYIFMKRKTTVNSAKCETTARAHDAFYPPTQALLITVTNYYH